MNLLLIDQQDFVSPGKIVISGRRFLQLRDVIKPQCGDTLRTGICNGNIGKATLVAMDDNSATVDVVLATPPPPPLPVTLICALQRPLTIKKILHGALTMGVKKIHFIHAAKVEKSYWQASIWRPEELDHEIRLALEQCGDTVYPEFEYHPRFKPFAEDILPQLVKDSALAIFGHPRAQRAVPPPPESGNILIAAGPEGGFNDFENNILEQAGMLPVTLGVRVLRSEYAISALLAKYL